MKKISTYTSIHKVGKLIRVGLAAAVVIFFGGFAPQHCEVQAYEIAQAGDHDDHAGHDHGEGSHADHEGHDHGGGGHDDHAGHDHGEGGHDDHAGHDHDEGSHADHEGHDHGDGGQEGHDDGNGHHDDHAGHDHGEGSHDDHAGHDHGDGGHDDHEGHDHGEGGHDDHEGHDHGDGGHDDHEGHDHGDHTGLLEVGAHVAFLRVTHDETAGTIKIEVFGPDAKSPLELEKSPRLNLFVGGKRKQVKTAGEAGVFAATDQDLRGHVHGGIRLKVGGKSYLVPLPDDNH